MRVLRLAIAMALSTASFALMASTAFATFHEMSIREVYPAGDSSYVELQMWAGGQTFVGGHHLVIYGPGGSIDHTFVFASNVANGANQSTIVVADTGYPLTFDETPPADETDASLDLSPAGGAVCWSEGAPPDCVSWGNFSGGSLPTSAGSPAAPSGVPAGMALRRSIDPGCPTLLEASDDHDNSAADFAVVGPSPRPNSVPPTEHACSHAEGPQETGGSGGGGGKGAPQTTLKRKPSKKTHDRTPTFSFVSDESGSTFQCKVDGKPFKSCRSPFTTKQLALGPHTLKVRAKDDSGKLDPSPASYSFKILAKG